MIVSAARDYYQVLQISPKADPAIVKAAYYTLLKSMHIHPDLGGDHDQACLINEAYEILSDPNRRREYDQKFFLGLSSEASAPVPNPFSPKREMRRHPRAIFQNIFRYRRKSFANGKWVGAKFCDISRSGACFRSQDKFKAGDTLDLDLSDNPLLKIQAKVRWVRMIPQRFGQSLYEGGVEFVKCDSTLFQQYLQGVGLEELVPEL